MRHDADSMLLTYLFPIAALLVTILEAFRSMQYAKEARFRYAGSMAVAVLYAVVIWVLAGLPFPEFLLVLSVSVIAVNMVYEYIQHKLDFLASFAITIAAMAYSAYALFSIVSFIQVFAIGSLLGIIGRWGYMHLQDKMDKRLERNRDIFQICVGIIIIAIMLLLSAFAAYYIIFALTLLGYLIGSFITGSNRRHADILRSFERKGATFGTGAIYIAVGTLLIIGLLGSNANATLSATLPWGQHIPTYDFMVLSMVALFICDAVATIFGIHGRHKLPFNKAKSWEGFAAYLISLSVIGFVFVGFYSIIFAVVLAAVESSSQKIDDNIAIPIAAIILFYLILALP